MDKMPFISIVVASYNRDNIISISLKSLLELEYPKDSYEIIFFDNNSNDNTHNIVESFQEKYPTVCLKIIKNTANYGSSGTYARSIKFLNHKWKYILKIDEDVIVEKNTLTELSNTAEKSAIKGFVGGKVLYYHDKSLIQAVGSKLKPYYAIAKGIGVNEKNKFHKFSKITKVDAVNGCMTLISRDIYDNVGWFDDDYFLYYDDHELMYKSNIRGYMNYYNPNAIAYHATKTGDKLKYTNQIWLYYSIRGALVFLKRNFKKTEFNFYIFFLSTNIKFLIGIYYLVILSGRKNIIHNLSKYLLGYYHGIIGVVGKSSKV